MRLLDRPVVMGFDHLHRLTDTHGLFEHAVFAIPRPEHGYCVDDVARALVVVYREPGPSPELLALGEQYLDFVVAAVHPDGRCRNRRDAAGRWVDEPATGDWWGRALWGLGVATVHAPTAELRGRARAAFETLTLARSADLHALSYAALGAAELLAADPRHTPSRVLLTDLVAAFGPEGADDDWPWPQPRMTYGAGTLVEALLAAGHALDSAPTRRRALRLLAFLLTDQTSGTHLSVTPVGGRGPGDSRPGFDQQPIEVNALAEAAALAHRLTGDPQWRAAVRMAWAWFLGDNDAEVAMVDPATGAGFDGLLADGRNLNQGAESTLAMLATFQRARLLDCL